MRINTAISPATPATCSSQSVPLRRSVAEPAPAAPVAPRKAPEPQRVGVEFSVAATPSFANVGTVADYFLRRQWMELRMAQNFEDLLCLPSLQGVDAYVYQQETV